jgi:hypothetical protein
VNEQYGSPEFFDIVSNSTETENLGKEIFIKIWWIKKLSLPLWCGRETKPTSVFDILDDTIKRSSRKESVELRYLPT